MSDAATDTGTGVLRINVVTHEGAVHDGEATFVAVPAREGEMGVLPQHTPLIAQLGIGPLRIEVKDGEDAVFAVRGGFLQVLEDHVTLLATEALHPDDIDVETLESEKAEILEKLQHPESDEDYQALLDDRRWVETREKVAAQ